MDFRILGPLEVRDDGVELSLGGGKQRALLALLLIHPNESLSTDRLIDELWDEQPPPTAAKILQNYVSQLRRVVGDDRLQTQARGYALRVGPGELDVDRFRQRFEEGRRAQAAGDPERASLLLRRSAARSGAGRRSPTSPTRRSPASEIGRLEELHLSVLIERMDADLALGRHGDLIGELETLVAQHPTAGAPAWAADARSLPFRPPGGGAAGLPGRTADARRGARRSNRARACSAWSSRSSLTTRTSSRPRPSSHGLR